MSQADDINPPPMCFIAGALGFIAESIRLMPISQLLLSSEISKKSPIHDRYRQKLTQINLFASP
jgi:hypothetical protein